MNNGNPDIAKYGKATQIRPGQRLPGAGRPPCKLKALKKKYHLSEEDLKSILQTTAAMTVNELEQLRGDTKAPFEMRYAANLRLADFESQRPSVGNLSALWDRAYGRAQQNINQRIEQTDVPFSDLPQEDRDRIVDDLIAKYKPIRP